MSLSWKIYGSTFGKLKLIAATQLPYDAAVLAANVPGRIVKVDGRIVWNADKERIEFPGHDKEIVEEVLVSRRWHNRQARLVKIGVIVL